MWSMSIIGSGLELAEDSKEAPKEVEMREIGTKTFDICKALYLYFLEQAIDENFSCEYSKKLHDFISICHAVLPNNHEEYKPLMFYTKTANFLSAVFAVEKIPGGKYYDLRAPLLVLYNSKKDIKELQSGIMQFLNYVDRRSERDITHSLEKVSLIRHFQDRILGPSLLKDTPGQVTENSFQMGLN